MDRCAVDSSAPAQSECYSELGWAASPIRPDVISRTPIADITNISGFSFRQGQALATLSPATNEVFDPFEQHVHVGVDAVGREAGARCPRDTERAQQRLGAMMAAA